MPFASRETLVPPALSSAQPTPRPEYPRPQFVRNDWLNLNGPWLFAVGPGQPDDPRLFEDDQTIVVPFAPESVLSGLALEDFFETVWYGRSVDIPPSWIGRRLMLHVQAADYDTTVWANGTLVGRHRGGFTPFSVDLTEAIGADRTVELLRRSLSIPPEGTDR